MATRKATNTTSASGAQTVAVDLFPTAKRNSTKLSPYLDDVADMVNNGVAKFYPDVTTEDEATKLGNSLRSIAKREHDNSALQVVFVPTNTPTNKLGLYVRCTGKITPKPRKAKEEVKPTAKPPTTRNRRQG